MSKWVYTFGDGQAEGKAGMRELLGGKGANLAEMSNLGLPVPPGFTISTEVCTYYYANGETYPGELTAQVEAALAHVGKLVGKTFGDPANPLLVSVRSGARASMPGMMDTVLNLGLNDVTVEAVAASSGDARFAYDSYRRFIQMYSDVVLGVEHHHFEDLLDSYKDRKGYELDTDLSADDWKLLVGQYKAAVQSELGKPFPRSPSTSSSWGAINAVFDSWMTPSAPASLSPDSKPVSRMSLGHGGERPGHGFRQPGGGVRDGRRLHARPVERRERKFYGEFLVNAQGEDVVAGIRTPEAY